MACLLWQRVLVCFTMSVQPYTLISDYNHFLILLWIANLDKFMVTLISQYFVTICQDYQEDWGEICFFKILKLGFWLWNFKPSGKIWKAKHWVVSKILTKAKTNVSAGSWRFPGIRKGAVGKAGKEDTCNDKDVIYNLCEDSRWKSKQIICLRYLPQQQHCVVNLESLGITISCISLFTRCNFCWSVFHISFQSRPAEYRSLSRNGLRV